MSHWVFHTCIDYFKITQIWEPKQKHRIILVEKWIHLCRDLITMPTVMGTRYDKELAIQSIFCPNINALPSNQVIFTYYARRKPYQNECIVSFRKRQAYLYRRYLRISLWCSILCRRQPSICPVAWITPLYWWIINGLVPSTKIRCFIYLI